MRKFILSLMFVALGGAWTVGRAICTASFPNQSGEKEWFSAQPIKVSMPCEGGEEEPCPPCITVALRNFYESKNPYGDTIYLTGLDEVLQERLEGLPDYDVSVTVYGSHFTHGRYEYIQVDTLWTRCMGPLCTCDTEDVILCGSLHLTDWIDAWDPDKEEWIECHIVVLEAEGETYLLNWEYESDKESRILLDTLQNPLPVKLYGRINYDGNLVAVNSISVDDNCCLISSLCDEWNVLESCDSENPYSESYQTYKYILAGDTIIEYKQYVKLQMGNSYRGALREGSYRDIYYVPADSTHEYLLYAFDVHAGSRLYNLWVDYSTPPNGYLATVKDVQSTTYVVEVERRDPISGEIIESATIQWIKGVGLRQGPDVGCIFHDYCVGSCVSTSVLCAYKDGEQVYASGMSEQFGCWYDSNEEAADTVKLYVQDGPGSSTVDPVDPNEIIAVVKDDQLIVHEYIGEEIEYSLMRNSQGNDPGNAPARTKEVQADTFRESVTIKLTDQGFYTLQLTNPDWNYSIIGTFEYYPTSLKETDNPVASRKVLQNGRLLIKQGDKIYTLTGLEVR